MPVNKIYDPLKIVITEDQTILERERDNKLRGMLKERREKEPDFRWMIYRGRVKKILNQRTGSRSESFERRQRSARYQSTGTMSSCGLSRRDYVKKKGKCNVKKAVNELSCKATQVHCTQDHYSKSLKIAQFNAQGLCTTYNDFMDFTCTNDFDMCAVTETWLSNDIGDSEFLPNGYQIVRKDRDIEFYPVGCFTAHNRGGVALVIKSEMKPKLCTENNPRAELIWCDIEPSPGKSTTIGISIVCDSIDKVTNSNCILLGHFNFPK